jgi:chemotaxis regulatin CheY-phosphate phosphatase CheZ
MVERGTLTPITEAEYEAIEAAVMETARGRWFLSEFTRRNRNADTGVLLDAIGRLEHAVTSERATQDVDRLRFDLMEMAKAISRTKTEIAAIQSADAEQSRLTTASEALDAIVRTTERATSDILEAAEHVQEAAWTLREAGADELLCGELDRRATEIYTACSFQDLTAQRTGKIVQTLRYLEGRINAMIDIWGGDQRPQPDPLPAAKTDTPIDLSQTDVDTVIVDDDELFSAPGKSNGPIPLAIPAPLIEAADDLAFIESEPVDDTPSVEPPAIEARPEAPSPRLIVIEATAVETPRLVETPVPVETSVDVLSDIETLDPGEKLRRVVEAASASEAPLSLEASLDAFAEIENLGTREKLRRFT